VTTIVASPVGLLLRDWRQRRRLSQLELALRTDVSARHLSFVENGRSRPTDSMILRLCEQLEIPLRQRNEVLLAGGYAPAFPQHSLSAPPMSAISEAIRQILQAHEPYPAVVIDQHWELVDGNAAVPLLTEGSAACLLEPPVNVLRLSLHPDGMAPRIVNLAEWRAHLLERVQRQIDTSADPVLVELFAELESYPAPDVQQVDSRALIVPMRYRSPAGELSLFSTTTVFGTPRDVTVSELAIESFYPADEQTTAVLRARQD
jgi:transcriptional regulator with XRE-family HTH domain